MTTRPYIVADPDTEPRRAIVTFMAEAKAGTHIHRPEVELSTAQTVTIDVDRPLPLCADGDEIGLAGGDVDRVGATHRIGDHPGELVDVARPVVAR